MTDAEARRLRSRAQRLAQPTPAGGPFEAVRALLAVQAQVPAAAALGLRARTAGLRAADVHRAVEQRALVRGWLMRGTLHLVAAEDLGWLVAFLGPIFGTVTRRDAQLGLDADLIERGTAALRDILGGSGPLTRQELVPRLAACGIQLDPGQAPVHLFWHAAMRGVVCLGPERAPGRPTYVLLEDWVGPAPRIDRDRALSELARRYLAAFAPAADDDLAAWSGLPIALARSALRSIADELAEVEVAGRRAWLPAAIGPPAPGPPTVRLVPAFDDYLLGYRGRELSVPPALRPRLQRGGGWLHPAVVVDGLAVAAWSSRGAVVSVEATPRELGDAVLAGVEAEVRDVGRFLDTDTELRLGPPPAPPAAKPGNLP